MEKKDFGWALRLLKSGVRVKRAGWNHSQWIPLHISLHEAKLLPNGRSLLAHLVAVTSEGDIEPWLPSAADVLAEDWDSAQ